MKIGYPQMPFDFFLLVLAFFVPRLVGVNELVNVAVVLDLTLHQVL